MFDKTQPLGLSKGSVRALIAFTVIGGAFAGVPGFLEFTGMIIGFYFGSRQAKG
jgi:hypothetical protein